MGPSPKSTARFGDQTWFVTANQACWEKMIVPPELPRLLKNRATERHSGIIKVLFLFIIQIGVTEWQL
jgi:hypothetical protein